ncbi:MAG: ABC transporter permease, partial [Bilophila wadsworthia]
MSEQSAAWEYKEESPLREAWKMYLQNRAAVLGLVLLGAVLLLTCVGPLVYPVDPFEMVAPPMSAPGEYGLICGSDYLGRDIFAGIIAGGKATMAVGGFATLVTLCIGITIGALAGYRQGIWDELLMRATEFFQVLPPLLLAMVVVALFSPSLTSVAVSIGIVSWPQVARVTRAEFMRIKEMDYVAAARTMGAGNATIMCRVILPNAIPPLVIVATLTISSAILFESGLSFLGLGDPNIMTWGMIIGSNK